MIGIHSGDVGDIIYGIPAFRKYGVDTLVLNPLPTYDTKMGINTCRRFAPFLESQGFDVKIFDGKMLLEGDVVNLDLFRAGLQDLTYTHLGLSQAKQLMVDVDLSARFLEVEPYHVTDVIIHRSSRYHNPWFAWQHLLNGVDDVGAVGHEEEVQALSLAVGRELRYIKTDTIHDLARVIAGAKIFIGNQSAPFAIAEGLKMPRIQETMPGFPNAIPQSANGISVQTIEQFIGAKEQLMRTVI